jgi:hypothetical protein
MDSREDVCDRNDCRDRGRVDCDVGRYAESAISVGDVAFGMRVGNGDGAAKDDKRDAEKDKEKSPRRISARAYYLADHNCDYSADGAKLVALELEVEAEGGLESVGLSIDGEVVLAEVGGLEEDLAHRDAGSEVFGTEESFIEAHIVVVGGAVLEG